MVEKTNIHSINLTERNERVYKKFFANIRYGQFSKWVNDMMNREFVLDGPEALRLSIKELNKEIYQKEQTRDLLIEKLNVSIRREELKE